MRLVVELNSNTKKGKKFRVTIKPNNTQLGKLILYENDLFLDELWNKAAMMCGEKRNKMDKYDESEELELELEDFKNNNLN